MTRTRARQGLNPVMGSATWELYGGSYPSYNQPVVGQYEACTDTVDGTRDPHGLYIYKKYENVQPMNGSVGQPPNLRRYQNWRPEWCVGNGGIEESLPTPPSWNQLATDTLAKGNPSRASVDLGVTLAELREAPQLLVRGAGSLLHYGANFFLSYKFGWEPLVNDVIDTFQVVDHVDQRINEIANMRRNGGIRRKVQLQNYVQKSPTVDIIGQSGLGDLFWFRRQTVSQRRIWGTSRWVPTAPSFQQSGLSERRKAFQAVYGLHFDASTAWNLIPWSWMIDWFGNFGDFLETSRNLVGARADGGACIMMHTTHRTRYERSAGPTEVSGGSGSGVTEYKTRTIVPFVMPEATFPFIGPSRLSILGSLAINRVPERVLLPLEDAFAVIWDRKNRLPIGHR